MPVHDNQGKLKFLIIRFSSIGDIILTTPVLRCLKKQRNCSIHFLTKKSFSSLLIANPYLDKIHTIENNYKEILTALKAEQFDYIIDLHKNIRSTRIRRALGVKTISFNKLNIEKWLLVNFKLNRLPDLHLVDRYFQALKPLDIKNDQEGLDYFIPASEKINLHQFFQDYPLHLKHTTQYIVLVVGAAHVTKQIPKGKLIELCQAIQHPIVLIGGKNETALGQAITQEAGTHVLNACGQLSIHQSASLIEQAWRVITPDTGMMHIAAAFQKKIISIWGSTVPAFGMYPYYKKGVHENTSIQLANLSCRPCSKIGYAKCPKGHFNCMRQISIDQIVNALVD